MEVLGEVYAEYTPEFAERESGAPAKVIVEVAREIGRAGSALATHVWRNAAAGNLGGWQVARALELLVVLMGAVDAPGGTAPNSANKFVPAPPMMPPPAQVWNELMWPREFPLAFFEMSFLLPHFLKEGRGKISAYFTRVYNPVWTNPDGMSWIEALTDESKIERHACLTPIWSETAQFADYVLPMGHGPERHDLLSQETHAARWIGFRQPVARVALERAGKRFNFTYEAHREAGLGEVWEEDEFWIELSWRIDPDGALGIRKYFESPYRAGEKLTVEDFYRWIFENSVPGLPAAAAKEGLAPLAYMRKYGAFLIEEGSYRVHEKQLSADDLRARRSIPEQGHHAGRGRGRSRDRRPRLRRLPHAVAQAGVLFEDAEGLEMARVLSSGLHQEPCPLEQYRSGARRDAAAADFPPADAGTYALRQCQVAIRNIQSQPAVAQSAGRAALRRRHRRTAEGRYRDRLFHRQGMGDRGDPAGRDRLLASSRTLAAQRGRRRRAMVERPGRAEP